MISTWKHILIRQMKRGRAADVGAEKGRSVVNIMSLSASVVVVIFSADVAKI